MANRVDLEGTGQSMVRAHRARFEFDTTALALTLSMALMFVHFLVDRAENFAAGKVDRQVTRELSGRFTSDPAGLDGHLTAVRRNGRDHDPRGPTARRAAGGTVAGIDRGQPRALDPTG